MQKSVARLPVKIPTLVIFFPTLLMTRSDTRNFFSERRLFMQKGYKPGTGGLLLSSRRLIRMATLYNSENDPHVRHVRHVRFFTSVSYVLYVWGKFPIWQLYSYTARSWGSKMLRKTSRCPALCFKMQIKPPNSWHKSSLRNKIVKKWKTNVSFL